MCKRLYPLLLEGKGYILSQMGSLETADFQHLYHSKEYGLVLHKEQSILPLAFLVTSAMNDTCNDTEELGIER
jgi:hypothetical protein